MNDNNIRKPLVKLTKGKETQALLESVVFLYANTELTEREIKKTIPFMVASKRIKYLGPNLTKDVKDLYSENYKTLKKD